MTTARIQITLSIGEDMRYTVQSKPKRSDLERAVLSAQKWLLSLQFHVRYFGSAYTHYHVWQETETGQWIEVEKGTVEDAEKGRQLARARANQEGDSAGSGARKRARGAASRNKDTGSNVASAPAKNSVRSAARAGKAQQETPAKAKFRQALERAQQLAAEKRGGGNR